MDIGTSMQIFTGVARFWLGLLALLIPMTLLKRMIFD
jgi:hypothetical protein